MYFFEFFGVCCIYFIIMDLNFLVIGFVLKGFKDVGYYWGCGICV